MHYPPWAFYEMKTYILYKYSAIFKNDIYKLGLFNDEKGPISPVFTPVIDVVDFGWRCQIKYELEKKDKNLTVVKVPLSKESYSYMLTEKEIVKKFNELPTNEECVGCIEEDICSDYIFDLL